jgi:hypothetical protein
MSFAVEREGQPRESDATLAPGREPAQETWSESMTKTVKL